MLLHHSHQHLHLHIPGRYVHQTFSHWMVLIAILADFYSKVCNLLADQSNSAKVTHILEEWFFDHGKTEVLHTENGPQYASAAFADCSIEWSFTHETSSPHYPESNGFAKSCDSGTNPRIALQHLKTTLGNVKLLSPSQMLYNCKIHTTIPSRICSGDPAALQVQEHLAD